MLLSAVLVLALALPALSQSDPAPYKDHSGRRFSRAAAGATANDLAKHMPLLIGATLVATYLMLGVIHPLTVLFPPSLPQA